MTLLELLAMKHMSYNKYSNLSVIGFGLVKERSFSGAQLTKLMRNMLYAYHKTSKM